MVLLFGNSPRYGKSVGLYWKRNDITSSMKKGMKKNPTIKKYLDKMVSDGIDEDTALNIMILVWLNHKRWNDE